MEQAREGKDPVREEVWEAVEVWAVAEEVEVVVPARGRADIVSVRTAEKR